MTIFAKTTSNTSKMIESLIVILPTLIAFCFTISRGKAQEMKTGLAILFCTLLCTWIYFFVVGLTWFTEIEIPGWLIELRSIAACLMLPFAYLVVCTSIGKNLASFSTVALFMMAGFVTVKHGAIYFDETVVTFPRDYKHINFLYNGKVIASFFNFSLAMLLQDIWVIFRTGWLAHQLRQQGLHASKRARSIVTIMFVGMFAILVTTCMPPSWFDYAIAKYTHFIIYSVIFTSLLILISKDFSIKPILDENEEPAYLDRKPRFEDLEIKCRKLYEEDKVYLIPSLKLEDLAKMLDTNRTYTANLMKHSFNTTFAAYTNQHRVEEAKKLLLSNPDEKMETIANKSGFATSPTFTKVFKAATGMTPSHWLSMHHAEIVAPTPEETAEDPA